jgi:xanthine dehydrogenase YagR molybdenum-binding subunit
LKLHEIDHAYAHAGFGAHFAEAAVDRDTGEVRVRRMLGAFAVSRVLNTKTGRSQTIGGMAWGIGSALLSKIPHATQPILLQNLQNASFSSITNLMRSVYCSADFRCLPWGVGIA